LRGVFWQAAEKEISNTPATWIGSGDAGEKQVLPFAQDDKFN
jgi:hypothetical protein